MANINEMKLPSVLIETLYRKSLVSIPSEQKIQADIKNDATPAEPAIIQPVNEEKVPQQPALQILGNNLQHFVILVDYAQEVYLPDFQLDFLGNILKACKLNLGDVAIINCHSQQITLNKLEELQTNILLMIGVPPAAIGLSSSMEDFSINAVPGDINLIKTPSLEALNQNNEAGKLLKSKLWLSLKQLLNL